MSGACLEPRCVLRAFRSPHALRAAPRPPPAINMKFAVYLNFIVVVFKLALQELLNVEQPGRPRFFLCVRDFRLQGGRSNFGLVLRLYFYFPGTRWTLSPLLDVRCLSCCARDVPWDGRCLGGTCLLRVSPSAYQRIRRA